MQPRIAHTRLNHPFLLRRKQQPTDRIRGSQPRCYGELSPDVQLHIVRLKLRNVSEKHVASIFRVEK
jgi:hypothetical protein